MPRALDVFHVSLAIAATFCLGAAGCGTSANSAPSGAASTLQPQSRPATGPTLGYVWDTAGQTLHPVQGVPGASIVGSRLVDTPGNGIAIVAAALSVRSGMAFFLDANGNVFQAPLTGGTSTQIANISGVTSLAVSNSGSYALLTGKKAAALISGLPQSPVTHLLDASGLNGILNGAVSDTGASVLAGGARSGPGSVSLLAFVDQKAGTVIATLQVFGGMQFVPGSDELIAADGETGAFTAISHISTTAAPAPLTTAVSIASPAALDITPNARWMVAANHGGDVLRIDLTGTQAAVKVHCTCAPGQVTAMTGTTLRLVTEGGGPLWIVDAAGAAPRVLFVPAITAASVAASAGGKS
jgi:hypothetical protein